MAESSGRSHQPPPWEPRIGARAIIACSLGLGSLDLEEEAEEQDLEEVPRRRGFREEAASALRSCSTCSAS